jgi:hypothetical protein
MGGIIIIIIIVVQVLQTMRMSRWHGHVMIFKTARQAQSFAALS